MLIKIAWNYTRYSLGNASVYKLITYIATALIAYLCHYASPGGAREVTQKVSHSSYQ